MISHKRAATRLNWPIKIASSEWDHHDWMSSDAEDAPDAWPRCATVSMIHHSSIHISAEYWRRRLRRLNALEDSRRVLTPSPYNQHSPGFRMQGCTRPRHLSQFAAFADQVNRACITHMLLHPMLKRGA